MCFYINLQDFMKSWDQPELYEEFTDKKRLNSVFLACFLEV